MVLLEQANVETKGKRAVVLGRSDIVGKPVSYLLEKADATVTVCHSRTVNVQEIVVSSMSALTLDLTSGHPCRRNWYCKLRQRRMAQTRRGRNRRRNKLHSWSLHLLLLPNLDPSKKTGQRLVGDVDYDSASEVASKITPVPGGVGPMTISSVLQNVLIAAKRFYEESVSRKVSPVPLKLLHPVPSDIDIARAAMPKHVMTVAHEVGILDHELELYGRYKAKVSLDVLSRLGHRRDGYYVYVTG
jgi:methylenetetrahydrofolate dehydrogenase (NADP+) / methenyltetrahydrofolate cyclohydrolase / formyltetrahydrofolate synthetase